MSSNTSLPLRMAYSRPSAERSPFCTTFTTTHLSFNNWWFSKAGTGFESETPETICFFLLIFKENRQGCRSAYVFRPVLTSETLNPATPFSPVWSSTFPVTAQKRLANAEFPDHTANSLQLCLRVADLRTGLPTCHFSNNENSSKSQEIQGIACGLFHVNCDIL